MIRGEEEKLPPSAKFVLKVLAEKRVVKFKELQDETGLPTRTLRYALRVLKNRGLIKVLPCLEDARERIYSLQDECYKLE
ncbi:MAG: winged helix-turn-helix transcriptional regulator [Sulfolobaceae archaeon]|nr:winged helix-turn-helix transcriptional regulator [Sulfolobaceae archaeon]